MTLPNITIINYKYINFLCITIVVVLSWKVIFNCTITRDYINKKYHPTIKEIYSYGTNINDDFRLNLIIDMVTHYKNDSNILRTEKYLQKNADQILSLRKKRLSPAGLRLDKNKILCVSITLLSDVSLKIIKDNVVSTSSSNFCDWAVILYNIKNSKNLDHLTEFSTNKVQMVYCGMPEVEPISQIYPKPLILTGLQKYIMNYDYVWVMDDDIEVKYTNLVDMRRILYERPSLISQPLIEKGLRFYKYLNKGFWKNESSFADPTITSNFIEMQAPIINSKFLNWFTNVVIRPTSPMISILKADYGIDNIWCGACQIIIAPGTSVAHLDLKNSVTMFSRYQIYSHYLVTIYGRLYHDWFHFGDLDGNSPCRLSKENALTCSEQNVLA